MSTEVTDSDIKPVEESTKADDGPPISKRGLKRLAKRQKWEEVKKIKRKLQKEKRKEIPVEERKGRNRAGRRRQNKKMKDSDCKMHIVVDLSFDHLMNEKDVTRCVNQINRCYSSNRLLENPTQFHVTSFEGLSTTAMKKQTGFVNWDVVFHKEPYHEVFEKNRLVYLTSESDNVLTKLEQDKVYIIGGLVDHNSKKGLCHQLAIEKGIGHARLPLSEYIDMKTRTVLTINHVFTILADVANGMPWESAILKSIPPRKNAKAKHNESHSDNDDSEVVTKEEGIVIKEEETIT